MVAKTKAARAKKKRSAGGVDLGQRVDRLERRVRDQGRVINALMSHRELTLGEVFRAFPGEIRGLADALNTNTSTIYDFEHRNTVRFPSRVAGEIVAAFRARRCRPIKGGVTYEWLSKAWHALPNKRKK